VLLPLLLQVSSSDPEHVPSAAVLATATDDHRKKNTKSAGRARRMFRIVLWCHGSMADKAGPWTWHDGHRSRRCEIFWIGGLPARAEVSSDQAIRPEVQGLKIPAGIAMDRAYSSSQ